MNFLFFVAYIGETLSNSGHFIGTKGSKEDNEVKETNQTSKPLLNENLSKEENELIQNVIDQGFKISPDKVLAIGKMPNGKIVWIEEGKLGERASGLAHILDKRENDFISRGISKDKVAEFVIEVITHGKKIGIQGSRKPPRDVFEYNYKEQTIYLAVSISDNGYVVGTNFTNKNRINEEKEK